MIWFIKQHPEHCRILTHRFVSASRIMQPIQCQPVHSTKEMGSGSSELAIGTVRVRLQKRDLCTKTHGWPLQAKSCLRGGKNKGVATNFSQLLTTGSVNSIWPGIFSEMLSKMQCQELKCSIFKIYSEVSNLFNSSLFFTFPCLPSKYLNLPTYIQIWIIFSSGWVSPWINSLSGVTCVLLSGYNMPI